MQTTKEEITVLQCEHCGWKRRLLHDGTAREHQLEAKRHEQMCAGRPGVAVGDVYGTFPDYWMVSRIDDKGGIMVEAVDHDDPGLPAYAGPDYEGKVITPAFLKTHPIRYSRADIQPIIDKARDAYQALLGIVSKENIEFYYCTDAGHRFTFNLVVERYYDPQITESPSASGKDLKENETTA